MASVRVLVGTRKGLWVGRSDDARREWTWSGPHFDMTDVYSCLVEKRDGRTRLWAGPASSWLGPQVQFSDDLGQTWTEAGSVAFPADIDASVERVWQLMPGLEPGTLFAGTEPGAVFRSTDDGDSWELERALWDHPHRIEWGAGFGGQAFHTILPHPSDPQKLLAAISSGGCYRTDDGGASWSDPCGSSQRRICSPAVSAAISSSAINRPPAAMAARPPSSESRTPSTISWRTSCPPLAPTEMRMANSRWFSFPMGRTPRGTRAEYERLAAAVRGERYPEVEAYEAAQANIAVGDASILQALAALSRRSGYRVRVKLRAWAGEPQTHLEQYPFDTLWGELVASRAVAGHELEFCTGSMAEQLVPGTAMVTVSSTAALEAIDAGLPVLILSDFGVNEDMLNRVFVGSGLLGTLADLKAEFGTGAVALETVTRPALEAAIPGFCRDCLHQATGGRRCSACGSPPHMDVSASLVAGPEIRITATPDGTAPWASQRRRAASSHSRDGRRSTTGSWTRSATCPTPSMPPSGTSCRGSWW